MEPPQRFHHQEDRMWMWVTASCGIYWLAYSITRPMIALYALDLGADPVAVGVVLAAFSLFPFLLAIPGGGMADLLGYGNVLRFGVCLMVASGALYLLSVHIWVLMAAQIVAGIGQMLVWLCIQALIINRKNKAMQDRRLASFALYMTLGQLLGPLLAGLLADHFGFMTVFLVYGAASGLLVFTSWKCDVQAVRPWAQIQISQMVRKLNVPRMYKTSWQLVKHKGFLSTLLCTFIVLFIIDVRSSFLPVYLADIRFSNSEIGLMITLGALSGLLVKPLYPFLSKRLGYGKLLAGTFAVGLSLVLFTPFLKSEAAFVVLILISGLALALNQPLSLSMIAEHTPAKEKGLGVGIRLMANRLAFVLNPLLFGLFSSLYGLGASFLIVGGLLFVLCLATFWLWLKAVQEKHQPTEQVQRDGKKAYVEGGMKKSVNPNPLIHNK
jgi:MFS family permease